MEQKSEMEKPDADVEKQQQQQPLLLPPVATGAKPSSGGRGAGCEEALPRASPTATRTLALVVLVAGAAFAAHLAAREEHVLLAVFASQLASFCVFASVLALCACRRASARWAASAAWQVLQWSLAMALPTSMAFWVVQSAPAAVGSALVGLAMAVVFACYAELVRALWPVQALH